MTSPSDDARRLDERVEATAKALFEHEWANDAQSLSWDSEDSELREYWLTAARNGLEASGLLAEVERLRGALARIEDVTAPPMRDAPHTVQWVYEIVSQALNPIPASVEAE